MSCALAALGRVRLRTTDIGSSGQDEEWREETNRPRFRKTGSCAHCIPLIPSVSNGLHQHAEPLHVEPLPRPTALVPYATSVNWFGSDEHQCKSSD